MEKINSKFLSRCFGKKASFNKKKNQTKTIYEGGQSIEYDFFFFFRVFVRYFTKTYRAISLRVKRCIEPCYNQHPLCFKGGYIGERPDILRCLIKS